MIYALLIFYLFHSVISFVHYNDFFWGTLANMGRYPVIVTAVFLLWYATKKKLTIIKAGLVLVLIVQCYLAVFQWNARKVPVGQEQLKNGRVLTAISFNLLGYNYDRGRPGDTLELIKQQSPDLVLMQELSPYWKKRLNGAFHKSSYRYRKYLVRKGPHGLGVLSRFPVTSVKYIKFKKQIVAQCFRLLIDKKESLVCNIHLASSAYVLKRRGRFIAGFRENFENRKGAIAKINNHVAKEGFNAPVIIAGDFKTMQSDPLYQQIAEEYADAISFASLLPALTFPHYGISPIPLVQIDYVFVNDLVEVLDAGVIYGGGSDHYPVFVKARL